MRPAHAGDEGQVIESEILRERPVHPVDIAPQPWMAISCRRSRRIVGKFLQRLPVHFSASSKRVNLNSAFAVAV
jgi:hypothetical protein